LWDLKEVDYEMITEYCPNLKYIEVKTEGVDDEKVDTMKQSLASGLKKLFVIEWCSSGLIGLLLLRLIWLKPVLFSEHRPEHEKKRL
jgi:hypothetical protein